jgi:Xaa-Pro aminopeptidase
LEESWFTWDSGLGEDEFEARIEKIRHVMQTRKMDALIICTFPRKFPSTSGYVRYVSNWSGVKERAPSLVILPAKEHPELVISGEGYLPLAKGASWIERIRVRKSSFAIEAKDALSRLGIKNGSLGAVGFEEMTMDEYRSFQEALAQYKIVKAEDVLDEVRVVKSPKEIDLMREAAEVCDEAFQRFKEAAKPGVREFEAVAEMEHVAARRGAEESGCGVGSGPYAGYQQGTPRARRYKAGDVVVASSVFRYRGYWAQLVRTGSIRESSSEAEKLLSLVSDAQKEGIRALKPGATVMNVCESINRVIDASKYEKQNHSHIFRLGHGMGLDYSEKPELRPHTVTPDYDIKIQPGMVIELHPSLLLPDVAIGALLGDLCLVTDSGAELLTKSDNGFFVT